MFVYNKPKFKIPLVIFPQHRVHSTQNIPTIINSTEPKMKPKSPLITLLALSTLILPALASAPEIKREVSPNRQALSELETKPLDPSTFASLTDWTHPGTLDQSNTQGKIVIIAMISAAEPKSYMAISKLTRMQRDYQNSDIIVAAIHPDAGWDQITEKISSGRITIPVARDTDGLVAAALHTDDYPDIYVIDRAGNLRFADIDDRSLKNAIKQLASENTENAQENASRQAQGLQPESTKKSAANIDPKAYEKAPWPEHNGSKLSAKNFQGKKLPVPMGNEDWVYNERPLENKVLVLDFWATWCGPCIRSAPILRDLQDAYEGKLEIVGIGGNEDRKTFTRYVFKKKGNYAQMFDDKNTLYKALGIKGIPHVLVISTDGTIRWQGNPLSPNFKQVVGLTIAADPMFAADN